MSDEQDYVQIYAAMSDDTLLRCLEAARGSRDFQAKRAGECEAEIRRRIKERNASIIPSNDYVCEVKTTNTYDQPSFTPLKELFTETDLAACLEPAHKETVDVPDKWKTSTVIAIARKYGPEAMRIVSKARIPASEKLLFQRRKG